MGTLGHARNILRASRICGIVPPNSSSFKTFLLNSISRFGVPGPLCDDPSAFYTSARCVRKDCSQCERFCSFRIFRSRLSLEFDFAVRFPRAICDDLSAFYTSACCVRRDCSPCERFGSCNFLVTFRSRLFS